MRLKHTLALSTIIAMLTFILFACDINKNPSALVGRWADDNGKVLELLKDGTGIAEELAIMWKTEKDRFYITVVASGGARSMNYERQDSILTFTDDNGKILKYKKCPKNCPEPTSLTDSRDGQKYKIVKIGEQTWMAENLNYNASGSTCFFDESYCPKYGRLYNWKTARTVCPSGWHLPSDAEWQTLASFAGGYEITGKKLKAKSGWYENNGADDFGFSALPGGYVNSAGGSINSNIYGYWWSSSEHNANNAYYWYIFYHSDGVGRDSYDKSDYLFSVRCLKGKQEAVEEYTEAEKAAMESLRAIVSRVEKNSFTDERDRQTYRTIKLYSQTWMAENLNYNVSSSKCYENNENNCRIYGRLYNWSTAMEACPEGWHLPSAAEWQTLFDFIGIERAGKILKASNYWAQTGSGTDDLGFSALPGGFRYPTGLSANIGISGEWWTSSKSAANKSHIWDMSYSWSYVYKSDSKHTYLHSVRCLQD
jgi:uncharacterized protein (TIGR02145 family)